MVGKQHYEPQYCTPDDVAETLDMPDKNGDTIYFTDETHPSYERVCKMICGTEDEIDRRLRRSWRVNIVRDYMTDVRNYQWDEDGWRGAYYQMGGSVINLRKDILPWDPNPQYAFYRDDDDRMILEPLKGSDDLPLFVHKRSGNMVFDENGDPKLEYVEAFYRDTTQDDQWIPYEKKVYVPLFDGDLEYQVVPTDEKIPTYWRPDAPIVKEETYSGDKILVRNRMNEWVDISHNLGIQTEGGVTSAGFWFDYPAGRLFIRSRYFAPRYNSVRITYRYGSQEKVPMAINRLACILVAIQIINMNAFFVKIGTGGDIANVKESMIKNWETESYRIFSSYQRSGTVHSYLR